LVRSIPILYTPPTALGLPGAGKNKARAIAARAGSNSFCFLFPRVQLKRVRIHPLIPGEHPFQLHRPITRFIQHRLEIVDRLDIRPIGLQNDKTFLHPRLIHQTVLGNGLDDHTTLEIQVGRVFLVQGLELRPQPVQDRGLDDRRRGAARIIAQRYRYRIFLAVAFIGDLYLVAGAIGGDLAYHLRTGRYIFAIDPGDDIAHFQAGMRGGAVRSDYPNIYAVAVLDAILPLLILTEIIPRILDTQVSALRGTELDEIVDDLLDDIHRYGKRIAGIA